MNHTLEQKSLTDIYRIFHPTTAEYTFFMKAHKTTAEYTFFMKAHKTISRICHIIGHKTNFCKFKKIEIKPAIFSDHDSIKPENRGKVENLHICESNNTLLNNQWVKKKSKGK